jgi:hypothetical protein
MTNSDRVSSFKRSKTTCINDQQNLYTDKVALMETMKRLSMKKKKIDIRLKGETYFLK